MVLHCLEVREGKVSGKKFLWFRQGLCDTQNMATADGRGAQLGTITVIHGRLSRFHGRLGEHGSWYHNGRFMGHRHLALALAMKLIDHPGLTPATA